ncbi:Eukaryotic aspartyl protease family protein [Rhynchospora pubera]|uniref:Eukaryotic aspartyl protease family protein n=1 Tax=Rhynchospora pubera TaxID=906938 RepID=A0AAV8CKC7_9POAL|nr:Eukaryotic aspartyl protease family protein [Rhynchospora pubera]
MIFGTAAPPVGKSTAMVPNKHFYVISLNGISVNGMRLGLDRSIFRQDNGQGCTIVDTGTPISSVPREAYNEVVRTLKSMIKLPRIPFPFGNEDSLCFNGGLKDIDRYVPAMTLHFEGLDLPIFPRSLFYVAANEIICLAMEYREDYSLLGALFQQNINMFFDIREEKIFMDPIHVCP